MPGTVPKIRRRRDDGGQAGAADGAARRRHNDAAMTGRAVDPVPAPAVALGIDAWLSPQGVLERAGHELARLVHALWRRVGTRPVVIAGRTFALDPLVERSLRAALPAGTFMHPLATPPHHAAARLAAATLALPPAAGVPAAPTAPAAVAP